MTNAEKNTAVTQMGSHKMDKPRCYRKVYYDIVVIQIFQTHVIHEVWDDWGVSVQN